MHIKVSGHSTLYANEPCDADLLRDVCNGDPLAWKRLVDRNRRLIRSVARSFRLYEDEVSDVEQMTWLILIRKADKVREPERLRAWLAIVASNESLRLLRRRRTTLPMDEVMEQQPDPRPGPEDRTVTADAAEILWAAVAELPARQRLVVQELFTSNSRTYEEIAASCSMPIGSIGPTRARALHQLQRSLRARGLGPE